MKILMTGGLGLIGQAIARKHIAQGDEVCIYDTQVNRFNDYTNTVGKNVTSLGIRKLLEKTKWDIVSHQAAVVGVGQSQYDVMNYVDNNVGFTGELIHYMVKYRENIGKILHAGSMGPYGDYPENLEANENDWLNPQSIYAATKLAQEELLKVFCESYLIQGISLRYFSVYGTEQTPMNPYTGVLSMIGNQLLNSDRVTLYDDGTQTRDLVHVEDVANAHYIASRANLSHQFFPINIGTGFSVSIEYVAERMRDIIAPDKEIVFTHTHRTGDIMHMRANNLRARTYLGWQPQHNIHEDIETYSHFLLENKDRFVGSTVADEQKRVQELGLIGETK